MGTKYTCLIFTDIQKTDSSVKTEIAIEKESVIVIENVIATDGGARRTGTVNAIASTATAIATAHCREIATARDTGHVHVTVATDNDNRNLIDDCLIFKYKLLRIVHNLRV